MGIVVARTGGIRQLAGHVNPARPGATLAMLKSEEQKSTYNLYVIDLLVGNIRQPMHNCTLL